MCLNVRNLRIYNSINIGSVNDFTLLVLRGGKKWSRDNPLFFWNSIVHMSASTIPKIFFSLKDSEFQAFGLDLNTTVEN